MCQAPYVDLDTILNPVQSGLMSISPYRKPFIRWAGGKHRHLPIILPHLAGAEHYYEPFLGGGAVVLGLISDPKAVPPRMITLSDTNFGLMAAWGSPVDSLKAAYADFLGELNLGRPELANEARYYLVRDMYNTLLSDIEACKQSDCYHKIGAMFLWLNANSFNGLWRENRAGKMNTPWGKFVPFREPRWGMLRGVERAWSFVPHLTFLTAHFDQAVAEAKAGDIVYFDPPYVPLTPTSSFSSYTAGVFGLSHQEELRALIDRLYSRGVKCVLSNSATDWVRQAYGRYEQIEITARRSISASGNSRGKVKELLIIADPRA